MAGHPLTADQADYLETLAELAEAYESANHEALPTLPPHELLAAHLENIGMTATEQSCQFKHKEVIIGKLEPLMDANERESLMSYKNSQNHPVDNA
jgi:hypothetical protein